MNSRKVESISLQDMKLLLAVFITTLQGFRLHNFYKFLLHDSYDLFIYLFFVCLFHEDLGKGVTPVHLVDTASHLQYIHCLKVKISVESILSIAYTLAVSPSLGGSRQHKENNKDTGGFTPFF